MDKTLRMSLLFDFYGPLLTERQQDIYQMYFHDDLSLGEIAAQLNVSRQAVYDNLKRSEAALEGFESKLQLLAKHQAHLALFKEIEEELSVIHQSLSEHGLAEQSEALFELQQRVKKILADS